MGVRDFRHAGVIPESINAGVEDSRKITCSWSKNMQPSPNFVNNYKS